MEDLLIYFKAYVKNNLLSMICMLVFIIMIFVAFSFEVYIEKIKKHTKNGWNIFYRILLCMNCSFVFFMTLFGRSMGESYNIELKPFASHYVSFAEGNMELLLQILMNIAMYIPLGFLLPCCFKLFEKYRYVILVTFCGSLVIELIQLIFRLGLFEVDDVINNTLGAVIGLVIYIVLMRGKNEHNKQKIS